MTDKELEEKATESFNNKLQNDICYCTYSEETIYKDGYIAGAKEIQTEIEKLKQQIEKMKCCENCKHRYYENGINYCNNRCQEKLYNKWELA